MIFITEEEANEFMFSLGNPGVCLACKMVEEYAGCEPDARNYECPECGEHKLFGFEEALMSGYVTIK